MSEMPTIALIAALPAEIKPLLRLVGHWTREIVPGGFTCYRFRIEGKECWLVESGMGPRRAGGATRAVLAATSPDLIVSIGFAGAVNPGPVVGDVVVAQRLLCRHDRLFTEEPGLASGDMLSFLPSSLQACESRRSFALFHGTFITTVEIASKKELATRLPVGTQNPVLEMETAAVARVASQAGVPLLALRSISDACHEELGFAITDFTTKDFKLHMGKIVMTIIRKPWILPQLLRLAKNSGTAGGNLATALLDVVKGL